MGYFRCPSFLSSWQSCLPVCILFLISLLLSRAVGAIEKEVARLEKEQERNMLQVLTVCMRLWLKPVGRTYHRSDKSESFIVCDSVRHVDQCSWFLSLHLLYCTCSYQNARWKSPGSTARACPTRPPPCIWPCSHAESDAGNPYFNLICFEISLCS